MTTNAAPTPTVYVHRSTWTLPAGVGDNWLIANAPRPLAGAVTWTGDFRHGSFYAATSVDDLAVIESWTAADGWPVVVVDNADVERRVLEFAAAEGYIATPSAAELAELGVELADVAADLGLPYVSEGSR